MEAVTATFERAEDAEAAIRALREAGFPPAAVEAHRSTDAAPAPGTAGSETNLTVGQRVWQWILGEENYQDHRTAYARALQDGGMVVSVVAEADEVERAVSILETKGPASMEQGETRYKVAGGPVEARTGPVAVTHGVKEGEEGYGETAQPRGPVVRRYAESNKWAGVDI